MNRLGLGRLEAFGLGVLGYAEPPPSIFRSRMGRGMLVNVGRLINP